MGRELGTVGVVGLGTMGAGIVEVLARSRLSVVAVEADEAALARGRTHLERSTARAVSRGRLTEVEERLLQGRVCFAAGLAALADCDLVVEAVPERLDLKRELLGALDQVLRPDAILATNTSSLSVTELAVATGRPGRVVGMHFFNPAPVQRLVEVVRTVLSEEEAVDDVRALAERLGKLPVVVGDRAGFIANALLFGYLNRAVAMYDARFASRDDIDAAMRLGAGLPMGPLALLDLIGLDTALQILETMYRQSRDRLHAPSPLLRELVTAGLLGRKSGHGFYTYTEPGSGQVVAEASPSGDVVGAHERVRTVERAAVVGSGARADAVAALLDAGGAAVLRVDPGASDPAGDADLVVVAVEDASAGQAAGNDARGAVRRLFTELDETCRPGAILATAVSWLPVVECAAATSRPRDVVGLHLPAAGTPLVEVVATVSTSEDVVATVFDLCHRADRHPVGCGDRAGFVVGALLFPYLNDAVRMVEAGYADVDAVDTAMTAGCGYPVGPFALLDEIGLDVALAGQRRLYRELREPGLAPAPLLEQLVTAGRLGRRTGCGFRLHR
ncbi:MAG TPA: 3-hydroxybutyryl-CoA dehydrogenase [Actinomycetales bacterium]|nr:3-hydroxybutyryl-CoA dehydrogenase [Actinomycetales bacterium]